MQKNRREEKITPFEWQRIAAQPAQMQRAGGAHGKNKAHGEERPMSAAARAERILATRWASPYSRAGLPAPRRGTRGGPGN